MTTAHVRHDEPGRQAPVQGAQRRGPSALPGPGPRAGERAQPAEPTVPLGKLRETPLDRLTAADVSPIVQRVMATHLDRARIPAAKFSSSI